MCTLKALGAQSGVTTPFSHVGTTKSFRPAHLCTYIRAYFVHGTLTLYCTYLQYMHIVDVDVCNKSSTMHVEFLMHNEYIRRLGIYSG